jgi:hypothetical protein
MVEVTCDAACWSAQCCVVLSAVGRLTVIVIDLLVSCVL